MKHLRKFNENYRLSIHDQDHYADRMFNMTDWQFDDFDLYDEISGNKLKEMEILDGIIDDDAKKLIINDEQVKMIKWQGNDKSLKNEVDELIGCESSIYQINGWTYLRIDCKE